MLGRTTLAFLFAVLELVSIAPSLGNQSPQGFLPPIQGVNAADLKEINSTMQQGFHTIRQDFQSVQQGYQSINDELQVIQQLLSTILSLYYNPGSTASHPALSCKEIYDRNTSSHGASMHEVADVLEESVSVEVHHIL